MCASQSFCKIFNLTNFKEWAQKTCLRRQSCEVATLPSPDLWALIVMILFSQHDSLLFSSHLINSQATYRWQNKSVNKTDHKSDLVGAALHFLALRSLKCTAFIPGDRVPVRILPSFLQEENHVGQPIKYSNVQLSLSWRSKAALRP